MEPTVESVPEDDEQPEIWQADQARRYMEARYGKDVWFKAPETFGNVLERWIWAVASNNKHFANEQMTAIETHFQEDKS